MDLGASASPPSELGVSAAPSSEWDTSTDAAPAALPQEEEEDFFADFGEAVPAAADSWGAEADSWGGTAAESKGTAENSWGHFEENFKVNSIRCPILKDPL